jgi:hypothetical protein
LLTENFLSGDSSDPLEKCNSLAALVLVLQREEERRTEIKRASEYKSLELSFLLYQTKTN